MCSRRSRCGVGDEAVALRWRSALEGAGASRETYASPGLRGERAFALFGLAGCHRRACGRAMREGGRGVGGDGARSRGRVRVSRERGVTAVASDVRDVSSE